MQADPIEVRPSVDESVVVLQQLVRIWHARDGQVQLPLLDGTSLPAAAIHVQVEHSVELTESIMALLAAKQYLTTAPSIRLTMECAVNATWWASNPAAVRGSVYNSMVLRKRRADAMRGSKPTDLEQTRTLAELMGDYAKHSSVEASVFEKRCEAIAGGAWIYPYYRFLSESAHGGTNLLDEYTEQIPISATYPEGFSLLQRPHCKDLDVALGLQVMMLTLAIGAWDSLSPGYDASSEIPAIASQLGFGEFIARATGIYVEPHEGSEA